MVIVAKLLGIELRGLRLVARVRQLVLRADRLELQVRRHQLLHAHDCLELFARLQGGRRNFHLRPGPGLVRFPNKCEIQSLFGLNLDLIRGKNDFQDVLTENELKI